MVGEPTQVGSPGLRAADHHHALDRGLVVSLMSR